MDQEAIAQLRRQLQESVTAGRLEEASAAPSNRVPGWARRIPGLGSDNIWINLLAVGGYAVAAAFVLSLVLHPQPSAPAAEAAPVPAPTAQQPPAALAAPVPSPTAVAAPAVAAEPSNE